MFSRREDFRGERREGEEGRGDVTVEWRDWRRDWVEEVVVRREVIRGRVEEIISKAVDGDGKGGGDVEEEVAVDGGRV